MGRTVIKSPKAASPAECEVLEQLPNVGPSLAADLRRVGIAHPRDLIGQDAFALYQKLCAATGERHDPCVLDTFMAAADFMSGAPAAPWWHYTPQRKALFGAIRAGPDDGLRLESSAQTDRHAAAGRRRTGARRQPAQGLARGSGLPTGWPI